LESRYNELTTPSILRGLIEPGPDVARRLADAEQSTRRTLARILFSPEFLGELLIIRSPQVGRFADRVPIHERVVLRRAQ
jgi:site-specific DNA recombinase